MGRPKYRSMGLPAWSPNIAELRALVRAGRDRARPLALFAQSLAPDDRVALETTGNALSIARIIDARHPRAMGN